MKKSIFRFAFFALTGLLIFSTSVGYASPTESNEVLFCLPLDFEQGERDTHAAAKRLADLNVGEPRTVRLIYFLPNDRPFSAEVVQKMKDEIRRIQTFYAEQMEAHGYGAKTFRIETDDQGEPMVHRVDGQNPDSHYLRETTGTVNSEIEQVFDSQGNIYVIVIDNSIDAIGYDDGRIAQGTGGRQGKNGGFALVSRGFKWTSAAHELGHAFGLKHDFNDDAYIMSYGRRGNRLSMCSAKFLTAQPYFNPDIGDEGTKNSTIDLVSPLEYPSGSTGVSVQLAVSDPEGLHQVVLLVETRRPHAAAGLLEVISCRGLAGERDALVEFDYNGIFPSDGSTSLSDPVVHPIVVEVVDIDGNVSYLSFDLVEVSPHHISFLEGHMSAVISMAFSPDGTTLASASESDIVRLWDVSTGENIATLEGSSVAFSPDGTMLASGSYGVAIGLWDVMTGQRIATLGGVGLVAFSPDGTTLASGSYGAIGLWDVETRTNIATLEHTGWVTSVAFSPDGTTLASASDDGTVKLWDVETRTNTATLEGDGFVAFSPDGTSLAYKVWGGIGLWDVAAGQDIAPLERTGWVTSVAFSPDGTTLASASGGAIGLWDVAMGQRIATLSGSLVFVHSVAFSSDGTMLASGSGDGTIQLWDVSEWTSPRPRMILKISGDNQQGTPGTELANPFIVEVRDQNDNPLQGAQVTFRVLSGGGEIGGRYTVEKTTTDADGRVARTLTLGPNPGTNTVEVSVAGLELETFNAVGIGTSTPSTGEFDYQTRHLPNGAIARLGKGAIGGSDRAITFSPDSRLLAVASGIGVWIYDVSTSRELALLSGHEGGVNTVAFSPDGTLLASGSGDQTVKLWDVATGHNIATLGKHGGWVHSVAFSPDGTTLASGSSTFITGEGIVKLWDVATGRNIATLEDHARGVNSLDFSPDGSILATGSGDGTVKLWEVSTERNIATLKHPGGVYSVAFSPDGTTLASGTHGGTLDLWDVTTRQNTATYKHIDDWLGWEQDVFSVAFSSDGTTLAAGLIDNTVKLRDVATGILFATLEGHSEAVNSVAFSSDGTTLAAGGYSRISLWDLRTQNRATIEGHTEQVQSMAFSPDGTILAYGAELWDVATRRSVSTVEYRGGHPLAFSPDGTMLAAGSWMEVRLWDVATQKLADTLEGHTEQVESLAFSSNGSILATASWSGILLWDVATRSNIATLTGPHGVRTVAFSPDGSTLASGSQDGTILLWDVATRDNIATFSSHTTLVLSVAFSPDGSMLVSGAWDGTVMLWDVAVGRNTATFFGHTNPVNSVAFSPDGTIIASGAWDGTVILWDVANRNKIATLTGHTHRVFSVAFSPDGTTLASGSQDGTVLLWDMQLLLPHPQTLTKLSGDELQGPAGGALDEPFVVSVLDQNGEPFAGAVVTFAVTAGAGTLSAATATTDAKGQAASILTLGSQPGPNTVVVTVAGLEPEIFTAVAETTPDFDGDGVTDFADFFLFADAFGGSDPRFDLDGSGRVDFADFFLFVDAFDQPAQAKLLVLAQELIGLPDGPQLRQNAPNPFNSQTVISYFLLAPGPARLELFALTGQRVAVLSRGQQKAGRHRLHWDGRDDEGRPLASGIYLYRLVTDEGIRTRKLTLLR